MQMGVGQLTGFFATSSDPEHLRLLDAARAEFVQHGCRRTSVGDIARRANVSRPTVYRRLGDKDQIVRAVMFREVIDSLTNASDVVMALPTPAERAVEGFVRGVIAYQNNPLMSAIQRFDTDVLGPLAAPINSEWMQILRKLIASTLAGPDFPRDAAVRAAELMLRVAISLLLAPSEVLPIDTEERARWFAATYFVPIIDSTIIVR
jgi:AcrR family transcriptional regulator